MARYNFTYKRPGSNDIWWDQGSLRLTVPDVKRVVRSIAIANMWQGVEIYDAYGVLVFKLDDVKNGKWIEIKRRV